MTVIVAVLGGGDLASGIAWRLFRTGIKVVMTELPQPTMVRRMVSFGEAMYRTEFAVEGILAKRVSRLIEIWKILEAGDIPILYTTPDDLVAELNQKGSCILVDARMRKRAPEYHLGIAPLVIGLGPGFTAGENCHAVIETQRGHFLGRVIWQGKAQEDTKIPEKVLQYDVERVLRSPVEGVLENLAEIGDYLRKGQIVARVGNQKVLAPFDGVLRGMMHAGLVVKQGDKIGDVDPRNDPRYCTLVSDKALTMGGAVLEVIFSQNNLRQNLWG